MRSAAVNVLLTDSVLRTRDYLTAPLESLTSLNRLGRSNVIETIYDLNTVGVVFKHQFNHPYNMLATG